MAALLIVDDDETIRDYLYDLFEEEHRCHTAETAEQAIEYLEDEKYDVILTDISMPGRSGVELLGIIRLHQPQTPVIIISGLSNQELEKGLAGMGAFDYLSKPFKLEKVEGSVERALEHRRQLLKEEQPSAGEE